MHPRARTQSQAEVDVGGVEDVGSLRQLDYEGLRPLELARPADQGLREVGIDQPVARLVRVGQRAPRDAAPQARVVELRLQGAETGPDVAKALPVSELGARQAEELVVAGEGPDQVIAAIPPHTARETSWP